MGKRRCLCTTENVKHHPKDRQRTIIRLVDKVHLEVIMAPFNPMLRRGMEVELNQLVLLLVVHQAKFRRRVRVQADHNGMPVIGGYQVFGRTFCPIQLEAIVVPERIGL